MTELVALDVGGTHARFARAVVNNGTITVGEPVTLRKEHRRDRPLLPFKAR